MYNSNQYQDNFESDHPAVTDETPGFPASFSENTQEHVLNNVMSNSFYDNEMDESGMFVNY